MLDKKKAWQACFPVNSLSADRLETLPVASLPPRSPDESTNDRDFQLLVVNNSQLRTHGNALYLPIRRWTRNNARNSSLMNPSHLLAADSLKIIFEKF